jgi:hypothetical protein
MFTPPVVLLSSILSIHTLDEHTENEAHDQPNSYIRYRLQ